MNRIPVALVVGYAAVVASIAVGVLVRGPSAEGVRVGVGASVATRALTSVSSPGVPSRVSDPASVRNSPTAASTPDPTYRRAYAAEHRRIVEPVAFELALRDRGWPQSEAETMTNAALTCEAPAYVDGKLVGIDLGASADGGKTVGPGIYLPSHPGIAQQYDLTTLAGYADAMTSIRAQAVSYGMRPLQPWNCVVSQ